MTRLRWWERDADGGRERYEREIAALRDANLDPRPDPDPASGLMRVHITVSVRNTPTALTIVYPANYPYFRFEVFAPTTLAFGRHQHPVTGALCLLPQGGFNWRPASMLAAVLISEQLKKIVAANEDVPSFADELPDPEPRSMYFLFQPLSLLVLPEEAYQIEATQPRGRLTIVLASARRPLRGYVESVDGHPGNLPDLTAALPARTRVEIDWIRIPLPSGIDGTAIDAELQRAGVLRRPRPIAPGLDFDLVGLLFEEEVEYRAVMGPGWTFLMRTRSREGWMAELVRTDAYSAKAQAARIPALADLAEKTVFQAGAGGLGAPAAHLLAQARVGTLRLADPDIVSIGNAVRWPVGFAAAGLPKVGALANVLKANYPETRVEPLEWFIGRPDTDDEATTDLVLDGADLVFDATAEPAVQQYLAAQAQSRDLPFVMVEATPGAFGGIVALLRPGGTEPCWMCLQRTIEDGTIRPPVDERAGTLQLAGCSTPTFTGASFDLVPLAALATRLIAQVLTGPGGYPESKWDVAVLANRASDDGEVGLAPQWRFHTLAIHPRCGRHGVLASGD